MSWASRTASRKSFNYANSATGRHYTVVLWRDGAARSACAQRLGAGGDQCCLSQCQLAERHRDRTLSYRESRLAPSEAPTSRVALAVVGSGRPAGRNLPPSNSPMVEYHAQSSVGRFLGGKRGAIAGSTTEAVGVLRLARVCVVGGSDARLGDGASGKGICLRAGARVGSMAGGDVSRCKPSARAP